MRWHDCVGEGVPLQARTCRLCSALEPCCRLAAQRSLSSLTEAPSYVCRKTISKQDGNERVPAYWGRCLHVDMSAIVVSAISTPMADAAYKSPMPSSLVPQWPSLGNQPPLPPPSLM